jgi:hypothetical protein
MTSGFSVEITALLIILVTLTLIAVLSRSFAFQHWLEQRVPALFPPNMARSLESIAKERPVNYFGIMFFAHLGAMAFVSDVRDIAFGPFIRYGVAAFVAAYMLYTARGSAASRAA